VQLFLDRMAALFTVRNVSNHFHHPSAKIRASFLGGNRLYINFFYFAYAGSPMRSRGKEGMK
jgi:hypothetical protein